MSKWRFIWDFEFTDERDETSRYRKRVLITHVAALKTEYGIPHIAGWSSLVARRAHNPKVVGSNPAPATKSYKP